MDTIKKNVHLLLDNYPETRDNDGELCLRYCDIYTPTLTYKNFILSGIYNSITMSRRQLQQFDPTLRGYKWKIRHEKNEKIKNNHRKEKIRQQERPEELIKVYNTPPLDVPETKGFFVNLLKKLWK